MNVTLKPLLLRGSLDDGVLIPLVEEDHLYNRHCSRDPTTSWRGTGVRRFPVIAIGGGALQRFSRRWSVIGTFIGSSA